MTQNLCNQHTTTEYQGLLTVNCKGRGLKINPGKDLRCPLGYCIKVLMACYQPWYQSSMGFSYLLEYFSCISLQLLFFWWWGNCFQKLSEVERNFGRILMGFCLAYFWGGEGVFVSVHAYIFQVISLVVSTLQSSWCQNFLGLGEPWHPQL